MTAERPCPHLGGPHTSCAALRCCDCWLPFPPGIWPRCSVCCEYRCSGCELYAELVSALQQYPVRGAFQNQVYEALFTYERRRARARSAMSDQAIPPTPPLVTDALMARGLAENRSLPPGWKAVYSHFDTAFYYWHLESGHAQWTPPTQCRPTAMAAPTTTTATAASSNRGPAAIHHFWLPE